MFVWFRVFYIHPYIHPLQRSPLTGDLLTNLRHHPLIGEQIGTISFPESDLTILRAHRSAGRLSLVGAVLGTALSLFITFFLIASLSTYWFNDSVPRGATFTLFSDSLTAFEQREARDCRNRREIMAVFLVIALAFSNMAVVVSIFLFLPGLQKAPPKVSMMLALALFACMTICGVSLVVPVVLAPIYASCVREDPNLELMEGYWFMLVAFVLTLVGLTMSAALGLLSSIYSVRIDKAVKHGHKNVQLVTATIPGHGPPTIAASASSFGPSACHVPPPPPAIAAHSHGMHPHAYTVYHGQTHGHMTSPHYVHPAIRGHATMVPDPEAVTRLFE